MRKILLILALVASLHADDAFGCMNEYYYKAKLNGDFVESDGGYVPPHSKHQDQRPSDLQDDVELAERAYKLSGTFEDFSDLGVKFAYVGAYTRARDVFLEIERKSPGRYQVAANLGTTYELLGQNDSALYWIRRAIVLNPKSHAGSEWIHVRILEAKIRARGRNKLLTAMNILGLDFGSEVIPVNPNSVNLDELVKHLTIQLNERMTFVGSPDPVVAQLLFDLGNVLAVSQDVSSASEVFSVAASYGYKSDLMEKRRVYFDHLQHRADKYGKIMSFLSSGPFILLLIFGVFVIVPAAVLLVRYIRSR